METGRLMFSATLQINVIDGRKPDRMVDAARQTEAA
jgi:hypothetical protein